MRHSLSELSKRTSLVQERAERAATALKRCFEGRLINGYGIYAHPSQTRAALDEAKAHLQAALNTMRDTDWPCSDQDYFDLQGAHNPASE
jgi:hypothetical protein